MEETKQVFLEVLGGGIDADEAGVIEVAGTKRTVDWLFDQLLDSTDTLPENFCVFMEVAQGTTYGEMARFMKEEGEG